MSILRFSPKLRLAPLWPALAAVLVASILLSYLIPSLLERNAARQLADTLVILDPVFEKRVPDDAGDLHQWVRDTAFGSNLRITVVTAAGTVLADSARTRQQVAAMDNHAGRPEIADALARGQGTAVRRSATTRQAYVYAARALHGRDGETYILRLAEPLEQLRELRGSLAAILALAVGAALAVIAVISWWLDRRLFRPLAHLIGGAGELSLGRFGHRLEVPDEAELAALARALNRLAERVEEQIDMVAADRDHLEEILASMSEGVLVADRDSRAVFTNPGFRRLFSVTGEVEGKLPLEITRHPELARLIEDTLEHSEPQRGEIELFAPERRALTLSTAVLRGPAGGAVVVARDTTEMTRLAEIRRDFVANVSHELKTPLSAIRGFAETLRDGALGERETARRFTLRILEQCRRLQALLDDLLTLSRLESVGLEPNRESVDLGRLVLRAGELMQKTAEERGVAIVVGDLTAPPLLGDPDGLERLLLNLLENAVKYNRPGGRVDVRAVGGDGEAILEVADTGIGIPKDAVPRLFERFFRVDKGRSREEGGTGLGLAIVKHVAQSHGGRVEVESRPGVGSTFRIRLPLSASARRSRPRPLAG